MATAIALPVSALVAMAACGGSPPAAPPALGEEGGSSSGSSGSGSGSGSSSGSGSGSGSGGVQDATMPPKDAPSDAPSACGEAGMTSCSGLCVDLQTDFNHCGSCTNSCMGMGPLTTCNAGACTCEADAGAVLCGTKCVDTLTDPSNCGTCGHICQYLSTSTGVCSGGACQPVVAAGGTGAIFDIIVTNSTLWWTQPGTSGQNNTGAIYNKVFGSGSGNTPLVPGLQDPQGIAADLNNIYWVDYNDNSINEVPQNGDAMKVVVDWPAYGDAGMQLPPAYSNAIHIAVDANNIYWAANTLSGGIYSVPIGSKATVTPTVIATGQSHPYGIVVVGGNVYWTNQGTSTNPPDGSICTAPVGGGTVTTLASGETNPWNIVSDGTNLYWTDYRNPGWVKQMPIGGGTPVTLASGQGSPYGIAYDESYVYWTSQVDNTVNKIPIGGGDGGGPTQIAGQQSGPTAILATSKDLFWVNQTANQVIELTK